MPLEGAIVFGAWSEFSLVSSFGRQAGAGTAIVADSQALGISCM